MSKKYYVGGANVIMWSWLCMSYQHMHTLLTSSYVSQACIMLTDHSCAAVGSVIKSIDIVTDDQIGNEVHYEACI